MTPARARVLAALDGGCAVAKAALAEAAACSTSVIDGLVDEGTLEAVALPPEPVAAAAIRISTRRSSSRAGQAAAALGAVAAGGFSVTLLEGVTGSGKTEVYFEAVAAALEQGGRALVLMPEIALTAQFVERFAARFGVRPAEWHSGISPASAPASGRASPRARSKMVTGARSALFLPFSARPHRRR